jgi:hypothetical protein
VLANRKSRRRNCFCSSELLTNFSLKQASK